MSDNCVACDSGNHFEEPSHRARRWHALLYAGACLATLCSAAETGYKYDALGRLREVTHDNGNVTTYVLDAAGNRMLVTETSSRAAPASINVPTSSITGNYSVSWTAGGTVTTYELWESANGSFTGASRVFSGAGTSHSIAGHGNGTFYYRVRGCNGSACTAWRTGSNGVAVTLPPGMPGSITVPSTSNTGSYSVSWSTATGTLTGYRLYEATNPNFTGETEVPTAGALLKSISGKPNGTYYYRVSACNGPGCSAPRAGNNPVIVTLAPGQPPSIAVPAATIHSGSYSVTWGQSSGDVSIYELEESTSSSFTSPTVVHSQATRQFNATGKGNGTYYYRVRACFSSQCSSFRAGGNGARVVRAPSITGALAIPATNTTGSYVVSWGAATGTVTTYELWQATNASFSGESRVYKNSSLSHSVVGQSNGTYYYRTRACNEDNCSSQTPGANAIVVTLTPGQPPSITVPTSPDYDGAYSVTWAQSSGDVARYELEESTNQGFTSPTLVHSSSSRQFNVTGKGNGTYYYRVRACYSSACSPYATAPSMRVVRAPSVTGALVIPSSTTIGNFFINWGASTGTVTAYQLREATNPSFTGDSQVHEGARGVTLQGRSNGTYYYRVRACNEGNCSDYVNGGNPIVISSPIPAQPPPDNIMKWPDSQCSWFMSWRPSDGATYYLVRDWSNQIEKPTDNAISEIRYNFCGVPNYSGEPMDYKPRWIKACNATGCSLQRNVPWP